MGGSSEPAREIRHYFLGFRLVLCQGGLDMIRALSYGERRFWFGSVSSNTTVFVNNRRLFGGSDSEGGVRGNIEFCFGGPSQGMSDYEAYHMNFSRSFRSPIGSELSEVIYENGRKRGDHTYLASRAAAGGMSVNDYLRSIGGLPAPHYRGVVSLLFRRFEFSMNNPNLRPVSVRGVRNPITLTPNHAVIELAGRYNSNPAHIIYDVLTNDEWGLGIPATKINGESFRQAAQTLYNEGFGLSYIWTQEGTADTFIKTILDTIDAVRYRDPVTDQIVLYLVRSDYEVSELFNIDYTNVREIVSFERTSLTQLVNEVTVEYTSPELDKPTKVTIQNLAAINSMGRVIRQVQSYPGIHYAPLAARVAERDLAASSFPYARIELVINKTGSHLRKGMPFRFNWSSDSLTATDVVFRITDIDFGDDQSGSIRIIAVEDKFTLPEASYIQPGESEWDDIYDDEGDIALGTLIEVPYYILIRVFGEDFNTLLSDGRAYVGALAARNSGLWAGYEMYQVQSLTQLTFRARGNFCAWLNIQQAIGLVESSGGTVTVNYTSYDFLDAIQPGMLAYMNNEFFRIQFISTETQQVVLVRAVLDTIPQTHSANSTLMVLSAPAAVDSVTQYMEGQTAQYKLVPTSSDITEVDPDEFTTRTVGVTGRQYRPYPPGNVRINTAYYPSEIDGPMTVTWAHRDRTLQTGDTPIGWTAGNVSATPEDGVTYTVSLFDGLTLVREYTGITDTTWTYPNADVVTDGELATITVEVMSVRDGVECLYHYRHTVNRTNIS